MARSLDDIMKNAGHFTPEDAGELALMLGSNSPKHRVEESEMWEDSILQSYADYIRNYLYTYKPEATAIDSSIDPNEEHIGPMAQDIEKVAPDCIVEKEGVKTVDGNRLALVNAGAIADLARKVEELELEIRGKDGK